ncbi:hypothetical protein [Nitrosomonas sp. HPC101]|uniref:hypothetical protein n=1 Tax=Nitrosomonas sp. HPC101 TaxID=1658667 RepID=UPI0013DDE309|nr:hypothetical protein [Nitrosomonas sp. HPC101]
MKALFSSVITTISITSRPSFWLNHEIAAISSNPAIFEAFARCWDKLKHQSS